jgi:hypothetical protein
VREGRWKIAGFFGVAARNDAQGQVRARGCARMELAEVAGENGLSLSSGVELAAGI